MFEIGNVFCVREDLALTNSSGMQIHCRCPCCEASATMRLHTIYILVCLVVADRAPSNHGAARSTATTFQRPSPPARLNVQVQIARAVCPADFVLVAQYLTPCIFDPTGPTVVYLHGNSGCRLEGDEIADQYLRRGMGFFCVDFGGCGISDGGLVTLGYREREDVEVVLDYLQSHAGVSFVCLYGRSMGAATALLVAADDRYYHQIAGLVLDSCYVSVREVALEIARKYAGQIPLVPTESVAGNAVDALREAVVDTAGFDLDTIDVLRAAPLCQV